MRKLAASAISRSSKLQQLEYSKGSLSAAAEVIQVQGGGTTANINGRYGTDEQHINGTVKLDEQGLTAYNIGGLYTFNDGATKLSGNAGSSNGEVINNIEVGIDHQSGATNHKGAAKYDPSNGSLSLSYDQLRDSGFQLVLLRKEMPKLETCLPSAPMLGTNRTSAMTNGWPITSMLVQLVITAWVFAAERNR